METFTKIAGVAESGASDSANPTTSTSHDGIPSPPPIPADTAMDTDSQYDTSRRGSRASIPSTKRRRSQQSMRSRSSRRTSRPDIHDGAGSVAVPPLPSSSYAVGRESRSGDGERPDQEAHDDDEEEEEGEDDDEEEEEDFPWGPSHPCFPHPNPHCAPSSPTAQTTRVIRVRRDWLQAGDLYPQYANLYPEILDPLISEEEFRFLISGINARLRAAFEPKGWRVWVDAVLGLATGWVWEDIGATKVKGAVKGLERFVEGWNKEREGRGVEGRVIQLRRTGFMSLDFVVPDPGIDVVGEEGRE